MHLSSQPTSNIQHQTFNIQHSTSNIQNQTSKYPTLNIEHPTLNIEHPTSRFNIEHSTSRKHSRQLGGTDPCLCYAYAYACVKRLQQDISHHYTNISFPVDDVLRNEVAQALPCRPCPCPLRRLRSRFEGWRSTCGCASS